MNFSNTFKANVRFAIINISLVVCIFSIFEIGLCLKGFRFDPYKHYQRFGRNFEAEDIEYYEKDADLFWKFKPSQVISTWWTQEARINSLGLRGEEISRSNDQKDTEYIICVGDSGTFGWSAKDDETFPYLLQKELQNKFSSTKIRVINAGVPGYSSYQGVGLLKRVVTYVKPKIIIFAFGRNDHNQTVFITDKDRKHLPRGITYLHNFLLKSRVYQWIYMQDTVLMYTKKRNQFLGSLDGRQRFRVPLDDFKDNLREAVHIAQENQAELLFIPRAQEPAYVEAMHDIAQESVRVKFIDLRPYTSDKEILGFSEGEHGGYGKIAHIVAEQISVEDLKK